VSVHVPSLGSATKWTSEPSRQISYGASTFTDLTWSSSWSPSRRRRVLRVVAGAVPVDHLDALERLAVDQADQADQAIDAEHRTGMVEVDAGLERRIDPRIPAVEGQPQAARRRPRRRPT